MAPTPVPQAPVTEYRRTLLDQLGPDGAMELRARVAVALTFVVCLPILVLAARTRPLTAAHPLLTGLVGAAVAAAFVYFMMVGMPSAAGHAALVVTAATGSSTPYEETFSYEESLAARGDMAGAIAAFEQIIADRPGAVRPRMRAAELHAGPGGNPARAAELFREIRGLPGATERDALYASSRLVDLYDGKLEDSGRALVELRRIIERHPGTDVARHARAALPRLKARLRDGSA